MIRGIITLTVCALFLTNTANAETLPPDTLTTLVDKTAALTLIEKGKSLFNEGKVRDALVQFRQASVKDPNNWRGAYWVGQCHYQQNNYGLALKYAKEAVELDKNEVDKDVYELLGRSYHRIGNIDSALVNYNTAISMLSAGRVKELQLELRVKQCEFAKAQMSSGKSA
ncbi:MAG: hypothetical protein RIT43_1431, partial [Bacteroidota bacterium]